MTLYKTLPVLAALGLAAASPLGAQTTYKGAPYSGTPVTLPSTIPAAQFDKGGQNVAYRDITTGNAGNVFRTSEDVDLIASKEASGGGYAVNNFQTGEWLAYTVNVPADGNYDFAIRAATKMNSAFHIEVDGVNLTGSLAVPNTGDWNTFQSVGKQRVPLKAGKRIVKVVSDKEYFDLAAVSIVASAPTAPSTGTPAPGYAGTPYSGTPVALPKAFPAAHFDKGGANVAYKDLTAGNAGKVFRTSEDVDLTASTDAQSGGYKVNSFQTGEWLAYTVNVPADGNYDLAVRAATKMSSAFHVEVDGVNVTGSLSVPNTGDWNAFQWVGKQGVPLKAGKRIVKVFSDKEYFDLVAVSILASTTTAPGTPAPGGYAGTPYSGTPVALPRAFPAAHFDKGGANVAYKDLSAGNAGKVFRTSEDVDLLASADSQSGGYKVNSFQTGEWLAYTVNVPADGNYDLAIRAATRMSSAFHIEVDGVNVTGSVSVPNTGGWDAFQWVGKTGVPLKAGKRVLKVYADKEYFDVAAISALASSGTSSPPPSGTAPTVSLTAPSSGQTVSGTISYAATASNAAKVEFAIASANPMTLGTDTAAPYSGSLDTTKLENGDHTLTAVAYDAQGKTATSQVSFKVQNGTTSGGGSGSATRPANLLFWSGFENGVGLGPIYSCYNAGCYQDMIGTDGATGQAWPPRVNNGNAKFQMRSGAVSTASTIDDWIVNQIQTVTGRTGAQSKAHYALLKKNPCTGTAGQEGCSTQDAYLVQPGSDPRDMYISFWRKVQPDLPQRLGTTNAWHVVFEWKTAGDYRVMAEIVNYDGLPHWRLKADNDANGGLTKQSFWKIYNKNVRVPLGEWFKFEVFWHRSKGSDGRVWMAVNGQTLIDKYGPNIGVNDAPINRIMFMQLYSSGSYPLYQWTDDVQIWSTFPTAKPGEPWYDGVYAPH